MIVFRRFCLILVRRDRLYVFVRISPFARRIENLFFFFCQRTLFLLLLHSIVLLQFPTVCAWSACEINNNNNNNNGDDVIFPIIRVLTHSVCDRLSPKKVVRRIWGLFLMARHPFRRCWSGYLTFVCFVRARGDEISAFAII